MEILFLVLLLGYLLWAMRGRFGFRGSEWIGSDQIAEDGRRKWLCSTCGAQVITEGGERPGRCESCS